MPKRNFADVFIGANPLGEFLFQHHAPADAARGSLSPSSGIIESQSFSFIQPLSWRDHWGEIYNDIESITETKRSILAEEGNNYYIFFLKTQHSLKIFRKIIW